MAKLKTAIVVGTRPELIRLSRVIDAFSKETDLTLVHTGQNYDPNLSEVFFSELRIRKPDFYLEAVGKSAASTIAEVLLKVDPILEEVEPDALLVLGDTNSCLSVIAAKRRRIPIFHMEAGNRCFDERVPEEINRRIVDHVSDINLVYTEQARSYLLREGLPPDRVMKTGSPMFEVLDYYREGIEASDILRKQGLEPGKYILVSAHREENVDDAVHLAALKRVIDGLAMRWKLPVILSTHPRTRKRFDAAGITFEKPVVTSEPFGLFDYVTLQKNALVVVSDSGTITEESSILGFPAVNIRETMERPEGMDEGSVPMAGLNFERVEQCVNLVVRQSGTEPRRFRTPQDYTVPNVSDKVLRLVFSYVDYVRRTVWQRSGPDFSS